MPEEREQFGAGQGAPARSGIAAFLSGKVFAHRVFSDAVLYWILVGIAFLLPIFFIPGGNVAPEFSKMMFLEAMTLLAVFLWGAGRLGEGKITVPKSLLLLSSALLVVQFIAAAIASPASLVSFVGSGYDIGTVNTFLVLALLLFLSSVTLTSRDRALGLLAAIVFSSTVTLTYHALRFVFGADFLSLGVFTNAVATPVGKWNDFAALIGSLVLIVLTTLYFFPKNTVVRWVSSILFFASLFFLVIVDFTVLWMILFVGAALLVGFSVWEGESVHRENIRNARETGSEYSHAPVHRRIAGRLPLLATILLVVSFVYGSGLAAMGIGDANISLSGSLSKALDLSPYSEVVLTPSYTVDLLWGTLKDSPIFGTGPNRFSSAYFRLKTSDMNRTPFWDSSFDYGMGRVPTYFGTTGFIGIALWLFFIVVLVMKGRKALSLFRRDRIVGYIALTLFLLSIYFWSIAFFYLPNISIFALSFLVTGALIALFASEGVLGQITIKFREGRSSYYVTPLVVIVIIGSVAAGVLMYRQIASLRAFADAQQAIAGIGTNQAGMTEAQFIEQAEASLLRANRLSERDMYLRLLSNIAIAKLTRLGSTQSSPEEFQARANQFIGEARNYGERAVAFDPTNFENFMQLGSVYDSLGRLGIKGTEDLARANYEQALLLNPRSPRVLFTLAGLEYAAGSREKAKEYLYRTLIERPNLLEAISFVVQLELQDNNPAGALVALQAGVVAEPTNFLLRFALGYLQFLGRDYQNAIQQFEAAVILNPVYADAKYFLGLSYARSGRVQDAIQQFEDVKVLNPDNAEVAKVLRNLRSGLDPLDPGLRAPTQEIEDALEGLERGTGDEGDR
jgi:Flp pilus assembly protein TadD